MRQFRKIFFPSIKIGLIESVMDATTTPLSHDEYEFTREIRTVRVNRSKARRAMAGTGVRAKRKHGVFPQLQNETRSRVGLHYVEVMLQKGTGGKSELSRSN